MPSHGQAAAEIYALIIKEWESPGGVYILQEKKTKATAAASEAPLVTPRLRHDDIFGELEAGEREQKEAV